MLLTVCCAYIALISTWNSIALVLKRYALSPPPPRAVAATCTRQQRAPGNFYFHVSFFLLFPVYFYFSLLENPQIPVRECADYDPSHALDLADASRMNQMHEAPLLNLLQRWGGSIWDGGAGVMLSPFLCGPWRWEGRMALQQQQ